MGTLGTGRSKKVGPRRGADCQVDGRTLRRTRLVLVTAKVIGNKGGVVTCLDVGHTSFCFVCAHLPGATMSYNRSTGRSDEGKGTKDRARRTESPRAGAVSESRGIDGFSPT